MNCAEVNQKFELFVLGGLPKSEQVAIAEHLATCSACRATEVEYRLLVTKIKEAGQPNLPRLDFARRVRSAVKAEIRSMALRSLARRIMAITGSAACLLAACVIWHAGIRDTAPRQPSSSNQVGSLVTTNASEESLSGALSASGAPPFLHAWQHSGARSVPGSMADGVAVHGQNVYLLQQHGQQARVGALDIETGQQKWLSDVQSRGYLLADDARVYCLAPGDSGKLNLVALDAANGKTLWAYPQQCPDPLRSPCGPTLLPAGRICWTANATVHVLSRANGEPLWTRSIPDGGLLSAAAVVNSNLYVATNIGLYCLNMTTGEESWRLAYGDVMSGWGRPLLDAADGEIYASVNLGLGASRLLCVELTGHNIIWSKVVGHVTDLRTIGDMLYLRDQNVQALDRTTGQLIWTFPATGCNPVTYAEGLTYFVDSGNHGRLVALNGHTGGKLWEWVGIKSCNAFIKVDGTGFIKTHDGVVHAIIFKG
jgi:outer membrane protein assembly factor BamB